MPLKGLFVRPAAGGSVREIVVPVALRDPKSMRNAGH